ncbi:phage baseplate assembly protein V [Mariprofundus ferrooxydans]|uniref:Probable bacteriophage base plate protein n=1 Tax=Mariprofundus ferrooxydans PV-1 TaxID=314345 RepID=Q0F1S4_9PROT|nr:phage baseplate assembly protein V [Mariprofundus ferrooxydans]EAU55826.1 probable bacteriophage base plate protein [Mariprofundus ferrooxydans PV-1]KON47028.1 baseplate protein [Mariprofundus ferrooxydans]
MIRIIDERIRRKLAGIRLAFRGISRLIQVTGSVQLISGEGINGESLNDIEYFQHFGTSSRPPAGSMMIVLPIGGRTAHSVVIATEHGDFRFQCNEDGEHAIYNQWGDHVYLRKDRRMQLVSGVAVDIDAPLTTTSGDLKVGGSIVAQSDISDHGNKSMAGMRDVFNNHTQSDPQGGVVSAPTQHM